MAESHVVFERLVNDALRSQHLPQVLPWRPTQGSPRWYVVAEARNFEQVREEVIAHLGVSYTDYSGYATVLDLADPADRLIGEAWPGGLVIRLLLLDLSQFDSVNASAERFNNRWSHSAAAPNPVVVSLAELLRVFHLSLEAGARSGGQQALDQIQRRGLLSPVNLVFLNLKLAAVFDAPAALLEHPQVDAVLRLNRPAAVSDILAKAIDEALLRPNNSQTFGEVRENFAGLEHRFRNLVTSPGECRSSSGVLLLVLRCLASDLVGAREISNACFDFTLDDITAEAVAHIGLISSPEESRQLGDQGTALKRAISDGHFDEALTLAERRPVDRLGIEAALWAASQLDSISAARRAICLLESCSEGVHSEVVASGMSARIVEHLMGLAAWNVCPSEITTWFALFEHLATDPEWEGAVQIAEHGSLEWPTNEFLNASAAELATAEFIRRLSARSSAIFGRIVPSTVRWIRRGRQDHAANSTPHVDLALLEHLARSDDSQPGLKLLCEFAADQILNDLDLQEYTELLANLQCRIDHGFDLSAVPWVLDLLGALVKGSCASPSVRAGLAVSVLGKALDLVPNPTLGETEQIRWLRSELGLESLALDELTGNSNSKIAF